MIRQRIDLSSNKGIALIHMAIFLTMLLLFAGLAVDTGRAYVVKAQLTKAVDGAALGAARMLNNGNPEQEATRIFQANFPDGYLGTTSVTDPDADPNFFALDTIEETGVNVVTVTAQAELPTTFMRLANLNQVVVSSTGEATRRMVDLSLVLDVSSSIGGRWPAVRDAARLFVDAFDEEADRLSLVFYSNGARVLDAMPAGRGFDKAKMIADIPNALPGGSTAMVEGLYRGWDELRSVANGQQSGLRVIVLFTDGASNSVPGIYPAEAGVANGLRTFDFPKRFPDPDNQTHDDPTIQGLFDTNTGVQNPIHNKKIPNWNNSGPANVLAAVPHLPLTSFHGHHRSGGIPTSFPLTTPDLNVNGVAQNVRRPLRNWDAAAGRFPAEVYNINNSARNLVEIIANEVRADNDGDYRIRIYTIGMGHLLRLQLGTRPEQSEEIMMRLANDTRSQDFNDAQLEGKYYFAPNAEDVGPAFQALQAQLVRLSK